MASFFLGRSITLFWDAEHRFTPDPARTSDVSSRFSGRDGAYHTVIPTKTLEKIKQIVGLCPTLYAGLLAELNQLTN